MHRGPSQRVHQLPPSAPLQSVKQKLEIEKAAEGLARAATGCKVGACGWAEHCWAFCLGKPSHRSGFITARRSSLQRAASAPTAHAASQSQLPFPSASTSGRGWPALPGHCNFQPNSNHLIIMVADAVFLPSPAGGDRPAPPGGCYPSRPPRGRSRSGPRGLQVSPVAFAADVTSRLQRLPLQPRLCAARSADAAAAAARACALHAQLMLLPLSASVFCSCTGADDGRVCTLQLCCLPRTACLSPASKLHLQPLIETPIPLPPLSCSPPRTASELRLRLDGASRARAALDTALRSLEKLGRQDDADAGRGSGLLLGKLGAAGVRGWDATVGISFRDRVPAWRACFMNPNCVLQEPTHLPLLLSSAAS